MSNTKKASAKSSFFWNMMGSTCSAAASVVLLMIVTRENGNADGGIFSIAYATAQLMVTIGNYQMRPYQSTDVTETFHFKDYFTSRIITCTAMMIASALFIIVKGYQGEKAFVVFLICLYQMIDALSDVYQGLFQCRDRLDLAGITLAARMTVSVIAFGVALHLSKDLVFASAMLLAASIVWFAVYDVRKIRDFETVKLSFNFHIQKKLLVTCFPLFIAAFLSMYIYNAPKYAIDRYSTSELQNIYNILFLPASVTNLLSIFVFRPLLTTLANHWVGGNTKKFLSIVRSMTLWVVLLTVLEIVVANYIGIPVLSWLFSTNLSNYKLVLLIMILGGGFSALSNVLIYVITIMRMQYYMIIAYLVSCIATFCIASKFVKRWGILGASYEYLIVMVLLSVCIFVLFEVCLNSHRKKKSVCENK